MGLEQLDLFGAPVIDLPPPIDDANSAPFEGIPGGALALVAPVEFSGQVALFDLDEPWRIEWNGMPEFSLEDLTPIRSITVHFESEGDVLAFEQAIGQSIGKILKSVWYPEAEITRYADKRYAEVGQ